MFRSILIASALALAACTATDEEVEVEEAMVEEAMEMSIVETAAATESLSTLAAAIEAAGLVDTLSGPGPFTVFAPTDAAFAALPEGTLDRLLLPENRERLRVLLAYHVLPGEVTSADIAGQRVAVPTAMGAPLQIDTTAGLMVDNANIIAADIDASNGVIHVIDRVLVPQVQPAG